MYTKHGKEQLFAEFDMESSCPLSHDGYVRLNCFVNSATDVRKRSVE